VSDCYGQNKLTIKRLLEQEVYSGYLRSFFLVLNYNPRLVTKHRGVDKMSTQIRLILMKVSGGHIRLKVQAMSRFENKAL
jgi:hypothetical protein